MNYYQNAHIIDYLKQSSSNGNLTLYMSNLLMRTIDNERFRIILISDYNRLNKNIRNNLYNSVNSLYLSSIDDNGMSCDSLITSKNKVYNSSLNYKREEDNKIYVLYRYINSNITNWFNLENLVIMRLDTKENNKITIIKGT